jgi:pimeloyl-ACP methyl ester carboxylesterase
MAGVPRALLAGRDRYRLATSAPRTAWGFQSRWRTARGVAIHDRCSLAHPNDTTPVVLLHGLAVSHRYLMPLAARLVGHHPVHVVDLPGFGLSGDPGRVLNITEHADHLTDWLQAAGLPSVVVLGNSFGCQVAVELAVRHRSTSVAWCWWSDHGPGGPHDVPPDPQMAARHRQRGPPVRDFLRQRVQAQGGQAS